mmetsp:Transcript_43002/g.96549  ORF Transcript_43002/g.96549 Transcript_43002/m.96549 type:complete len:86 (-) Transcript_43002:853-1110(-)
MESFFQLWRNSPGRRGDIASSCTNGLMLDPLPQAPDQLWTGSETHHMSTFAKPPNIATLEAFWIEAAEVNHRILRILDSQNFSWW